MKLIFSILSLAAASSLAHAAGPLNPPSGAIASTAKPLSEVEPRIAINATNTPGDADSQFRITAAGSYYLTGNIVGVASRKAIEVVGSNITIDLNGFAIIGVAGGGGSPGDGVNIDTVSTGGTVVVKNGSITNCRTGVNMPLNYGHIRLEDCVIASCTLSGAIVNSGSVRNCHFRNNAGVGLMMISNFTVEGCTSTDNTSNGFVCSELMSTFSRCVARSNDGTGFSTPSAVINDCQAIGNSFVGFNGPSVITGSYATGGTIPLILNGGVATNCTIEGGSQSAVWISNRTRITNCKVFGAAQNGILATGNGCTVKDCTVNSCGTSAGQFAGIKVESTDCAISDNHVSQMTTGGDDIGIWITGTGNMVVRNAVAAASDFYNIAAGNAAGPQISSATVATTTSPMANVGY